MIKEEWTPKFFSLLKGGISPQQARQDVISGILVGIIALPLAIAFAIASGVSPDKGIITAIIAGFIISLLGGSRVQIGGPTGAFIVIVAGIIHQYGIEGLLIATVMAGIFLILMGLLKMGSLLKYIPQTLITGFTSGIAVIIFTTQIKDFLGIDVPGIPEPFLAKWLYYFRNLGNINPASLSIGLVTIFILMGLPKLTKKIPPAITAIILTTAVVKLAQIPVETIYTRFGNISFQMIKPGLPEFDMQTLAALVTPALSIAILGSLESLLSAVVADGMIGGSHRSNVELIAQGIANVVTPFFGGIPATGAIARTAANIKNGGRSPIAGIVHALTLLVIYVVAMPVVKFIPLATLAGILIVVSWNMGEFKEFSNIIRINRYEALVLLATFLLTLFTDLTIAIPVGFIMAVILFMKRMADSVEISPLLTSKAGDGKLFSNELGEHSENIIIYELNGPMFFGSVHHLLNINKEIKPNHSILILRFRYVPIVDASGLNKLKNIIRNLQKKDVKILYSGVNEMIIKKFLNQNIADESCLFKDIQSALAFAEESMKSNSSS
jgi:SulP family sulfate permease